MRRPRGRRIAVLCAAAGVLTIAASVWAWVANAVLEIRVVPDRLVWEPGETVTGKILLRNWHWTVVRMQKSELPEASLVDSNGKSPPWLSAGFRVYSDQFEWRSDSEVEIAAFESIEIPFKIETEPLSADGGFLVEDGAYSVLPVDQRKQLSVPVRLRSTIIQLRTHSGESQGARIVRFDAGDKRLNVLRWSGRIESYDVDSGPLAATVDVGDHRKEPEWPGNFEFSPDGILCAVLVEAPGEDPKPKVQLYKLEAMTGDARVFSIPFVPGTDCTPNSLRGFDVASRTLRVSRPGDFLEIDLETGNLTRTEMTEYIEASPDGRHLVTWHPTEPSIFSRKKGVTLPIHLPVAGETDECSNLTCLRGIYFGHEKSHTIFFKSYDGDADRSFKSDATIPIRESADGRYLVLQSADHLEVWDMQTYRKLWALERGKDWSVSFTSEPLRLVCGVRHDAPHALCFDPSFEVRDVETGRLLRTITASLPVTR